MERIPPSKKIKQEVEELLQGWEAAGHPLDNFIRLGVLSTDLSTKSIAPDVTGWYRMNSRRPL